MAESAPPDQAGLLHPWQFFLLGGMLAATATVIVATGQSPANIIILSLTVVAVSFVGLGAYRILSPLVSPEVDLPTTIGGRTRLAIEREKALVLRSIKELEFDFAMGKISKTDFAEMAGRLRLRALGLMQQLDAGGGYREKIEQEVARRISHSEGDGFSRRQDQTATAEAIALRATEAIALRATEAIALRATEAVALRACGECGLANDADARFCKACGEKL